MRFYAIFLSEGDVIGDEPLYRKVVEEAKRMGLSGITVVKGHMGFGKHKDSLDLDPFHSYGDKPVIVIVVETEEKGERLVQMVKNLKSDALVVSWEVTVH
ncbi:MAG: DUF190 domain-containing protein [Crenarchaeota archaeon]|nr:DUF190 domain-containing protein [Thermoproteota archaeon]